MIFRDDGGLKKHQIMEDGGFTPSTLPLPADVLSDEAMDRLLYDGFWLETITDCVHPSTSPVLTSSFFFPNPTSSQSENHFGHLKDQNFENFSVLCSQMDEFPGENQTQKQENIIPGSIQSQGTETSRKFWVGPTRNPTPNASVKTRLMQAIDYLKESMKDRDVLIQIWVPINRRGRQVLTTDNQPFSLNPSFKSLAEYRHVSRTYQFAAEDNSKELIGLPGRVFLKKLPEWTPDVRFFRQEEYPRVNYAHQYNVRGSLALPVFQRSSGTCLGVIEIVTTTCKVNYHPELEHVCKALEAVDLRGYNNSNPPKIKAGNTLYEAALVEIQNVLKYAYDAHQLPLAQTWALCIQQGKGGCRHSDENYSSCVSTVDFACYVLDPQVQLFHEACSEHHLLKGEGVAGRAFMTNQPCFATDIKAFSKTEYPLSHHARMFGLSAAVAIRLRSSYTGLTDFVLEFFLPRDCKDAEDQKAMLNSLSYLMQNICKNLRVITDQEFAEEATSLYGENGCSSIGSKLEEKLSPNLSSPPPPPKDPPGDASSWFTHMMKAQEKGKGIAVSVGSQSEEPEEEFKMTNQWSNPEMGLSTLPFGSKAKSEGSGGFSSTGEQCFSGAKRSGERRRTKAEKAISLQVLRQYFAGSLKDAAKNIGVCPTTLKRICRQYGITRWPSRKIKKVGHSLRKLQLVIDSVQGADGAIQLSSSYSNFPELSSHKVSGMSTDMCMLKRKEQLQQADMVEVEGNNSLVKSAAGTGTKSHSSSSTSSFCCSSGAKESQLVVNTSSGGDALSAKQCEGSLRSPQCDSKLQGPGNDELKQLPVRHEMFHEHASCVSLPKSGGTQLQDAGTFRVKASFGEENVRFSLLPGWSFSELHRELLRRFHLVDDDVGRRNTIHIKYLDDDMEWVLLTCDADLQECIDIHKSTASPAIKLSLHQNYHPINLGSSSATAPSSNL